MMNHAQSFKTETIASEQTKYAPKRSWPATLQLSLAKLSNYTRLVRNSHFGPLRVLKPFYPEAPAVCHIYLIHPPGGLVSGDNLKITVDVAANSHGVITTPSAGKMYQAVKEGTEQRQHQYFNVETDGTLEWLPQENIVFDGAAGQLKTVVNLEGTARFTGWEITCLGRKAGNYPFDSGYLNQKLEIFRDGKPLLMEQTLLQASSEMIGARWGLQSQTVIGSMVGTLSHIGESERAKLVDELRRITDADDTTLSGVTERLDLVLIRTLGDDSEKVKNLLIECWKVMRPSLSGMPAREPRIWRT